MEIGLWALDRAIRDADERLEAAVTAEDWQTAARTDAYRSALVYARELIKSATGE